jgi:hypothetical protein
MRSLLLAGLAVLTLTLGAACGDTIVNVPNPPTAPTNPVVTSRIEFRVTGNATSVRVRYSSPTDGLAQTVTTLPYFATFTTTSDSLFLSIEATPISYSAITNYPFLSIQILVNGNLFREATSTDFLLYTISANGTWRR